MIKKRKTDMLAEAVAVLAFTALLLLAGVLTQPFFPEAKFYNTPVFMVLMALAAADAVRCTAVYMRRRMPPAEKIGFFLCHAGIALVALASFASAFFSERLDFNVPVNSGIFYDSVAKTDGGEVNFGFGISVPEFAVVSGAGGEDADYRLTLRVGDGAEIRDFAMGLNKPLSYGGWKFYFMDYLSDGGYSVCFRAKKDPAGIFIGVGIWAALAGTAVMCFSGFVKPAKREGEAERNEP